MIYNNREYPHPVLGIGDSISGKFEINLNVKLGKRKIVVEPVFKLTNDKISNLINTNQALYMVQIYCSATMFRKAYKVSQRLSGAFEIDTPKLRDRVEVDFFICANKQIDNYYNPDQHPDYNKQHFTIDKGDLLAYGGKGVFHASKTFAKLKSISSFMAIDRHDKENGSMYNFYDGDRITILLSKNDYLNYQKIRSSAGISDILHSSIVMPALMDAINFIQTKNNEFNNKAWFEILNRLIDESKEDQPLAIAQEILENPINRAFTSIQKLIDYE